MPTNQPRIRPLEDRDPDAVVDLSLRAWEPVFASIEQTLGSEIFQATASGLKRGPTAGAETRIVLFKPEGV